MIESKPASKLSSITKSNPLTTLQILCRQTRSSTTILILISVFSLIQISQASFILTLSSNGKNRTISQILPFSCWHPVVAIHHDQITIYITENGDGNQGSPIPIFRDGQQSTQNMNFSVKITLKELNYTEVVDFKQPIDISLKIDASPYPLLEEVTQTISIEIVQKVLFEQQNPTPSPSEEYLVYLIRCTQNPSDEMDYKVGLPLTSLILTQLLAMLMIATLPYNIQYRRLKPIAFHIPFALLYSLLLFLGIYLSSIISTAKSLWQEWFIAIFSFIWIFIYVQDLISILLKHRRILTDAIAFGISFAIVAMDLTILHDAWFLNDVIAIFTAASLIKFVIIRKLKSSLFPLLILWAFFLCRQFAIDFKLQTFEQSLELQLIPLFLQIPALGFDDSKGFQCSAFGTSKVIAFGLILNYSIRIDLFLSRKFYQTLTISLAILLNLAELAFNIFLDELPAMSFLGIILFIPISLILMLFFANKRGQWAELWDGNFYDLAVNNVKISKRDIRDIRDSGGSGSLFNSNENDFGENLRINQTLVAAGGNH